MQPIAAVRPSLRSFLPAGAVTGIGSLPFTSAPEAIDAVAASSPQVPFWPQLPKVSDRESIIAQGLDALSHWIEPRSDGYGFRVKEGKIDRVVEALHRGDGELTAANAAGFDALCGALSAGRFGSAIAVKGQIEGPITLAAYLFRGDRPFLSDPGLFSAVAFHVSQIICWQIERLKQAGSPVVLFVDEPALCLETPFLDARADERRLSALAEILDGIRARGAYAGLHCCAARPLSRMCRVRPDIISFDAHQGLEDFFADADALTFARNGGVVAYGLVPTWQDMKGLSPVSVFARWLTLASLAGDPQQFARTAMVTSTCGLGLLHPDAVAESFAMAQSVGQLMHAFAGAAEPYGLPGS